MTQVIVGQPITLGLNPPYRNGQQNQQQRQQQQNIFSGINDLGDNLCGPLCGPWNFGPFGECGAANCCAVINGFTLIIFGIISLALGATVATYYTDFNGYTYAPIWAGVLCLLAGMIGVSTCCCCGNKEALRYVLFMFFVTCLIVVVTALVQLVTEGVRSSEIKLGDDSAKNDQERYDAIKALHTSTAVFGALAVLAAFIGGILACFCSCCGDDLGNDNNQNNINPQFQQQQLNGFGFNQPPPAFNQGGINLGGGGLPMLGGGLGGGGLGGRGLGGGGLLGMNMLNGGNLGLFNGGQNIII